MSIAALKKLTLAGPTAQKEAALAHLQALGSVHVLPLNAPGREPEKVAPRKAADAYKALRFLTPVAGERRQVTRDDGFDVQAFIGQVLDLRQRMRDVGDRRDLLEARVKALEPWGELVFPEVDELGGTLVWTYELPVRQRAVLDHVALPWAIVGQDTQRLFVVLLAPEEPPADVLPVPRTHIGSTPRSVLLQEWEDAEVELEALRAERIALTRYLTLFRASLSEAETQAELNFALQQTRDEDAFFVLHGWVPETEVEAITDYAGASGLAVIVDDPAWDEVPPTLLVQSDKAAAGVDLAMFYQVPSSRDWDPALLLMGSFAVFFAMIVADAGYGVVILLGLVFGWQRLGTSVGLRAWRRMGLILAGATIAYGMLVGSYFGAAPREGTALSRVALLDLNDFDTMMRLSILVGAAHIVLALAMSARARWHRRSSRANLGWIAAIVGGMALWLSGMEGSGATLGLAGLIGGTLVVVLFSSDRPVQRRADWAWRLLDGVKALNGFMGGFGDILSYMRLFALGLASASLAVTFNDLAVSAREGAPGVGVLFAILILLVGHVLNFALAMMSGVVHGLRLNYIEFFKWGLPEEGTAFRPLTRKEVRE